LKNSGKVIAAFNGHLHWNRINIHDAIPYFSIQSFVMSPQNKNHTYPSFAQVEVGMEKIDIKVLGEDPETFSYEFRSGTI
jgi:hypothetical protein